ncbi:MAG: hypothetical protein HKN79_10765 [Flavobacteriales bacterium]|nr:hypothetical protein [Flavobacteriales bacterium]
MRIFLHSILFILCGLHLSAQDNKKIQLIRADVIEYDAGMVKAQRLLGRVIFEHQGSRMYCDSAYLYEESNRFESFGNVRITDKKDLTIRGKRLDYDADERKAEIFEEITLRDGEMTLTTDYIEYQLDDRMASYFGGGKIVSSANRNVLTSSMGHYFADSKIMHFKDTVELRNPQYTMYTDTLHYHSLSEQAYFLGPTIIDSDENRIYCENGWYDTVNDKARFGENAHIWSNEQQLLGDSLYYDRNAGYGEAFGDVLIIDTLNQLQISGQYGKHLEEQDMSFVTDGALMEQFFEADTLLLHADTLQMTADTLEKRKITAFYGVQIFKTDLQGVCDSLVYTEADSLIRMYEQPFLWSEENQISGERIDLKTYEGTIESMYTENMAFIISQVDSIHYNQIKGRTLTGYFKENELDRVVIEGNGECIYYAVEEVPEEDASDSTYVPKQRIIGVNVGACSSMVIGIEDRTISRVKFITKPDNAFYPLDKISQEALILKDFTWNGDQRPLDRSALIQ